MNNTPKGLRLQIGIFGRTNVGKSSLLNLLAGQNVAITSHIAGTTTDVVEKVMELLPLGPVVFLDTAGLDDKSELAAKRLQKTAKIYERADIILIVTEPNIWTEFEEQVLATAKKQNLPVLIVVNKIDVAPQTLKLPTEYVTVSALDSNRDEYLKKLKHELIKLSPEHFFNAPPLLSDLIPQRGTVVFIIPIDSQAPKGRIILPQVQAIRETLDCEAVSVVVNEREYPAALANLKKAPDLVVCDSQVVDQMVKNTPLGIKCTTYSTLLARSKGDLATAVSGARHIAQLKPNDRVLVAEACTHHALLDDIGRIKIPRWLREYLGFDLQIDTYTGHDFPEDITKYKLIIHCGSCMLNRRETLWRYSQAKEKGVAITNYGVCISFLQGVLEIILEPFNI